MIQFSRLRWRNFLSFGNTFTEVHLDRSPTTLIVGTNGVGKSTMLDALTFVLFNKPFRKINKPLLVNSVNNKECVVEVEFRVGERPYLVRRGIKPNIFEIEENGKPLEQDAANGDFQAFLEKNILKMNYTTFTQVVILGKATYKPFMQLTTGERRVVIEELLGLKIFSTMNRVLKDRVKMLRTDLTDAHRVVDTLSESIDVRTRYIERVKGEQRDRRVEIQAEIDSLMVAIDGDRKIMEDLMVRRAEMSGEVGDASPLTRKLKQLNGFDAQFKVKLGQLRQEIGFFNGNDVCPTCAQSISTDFRETETASRQEKISKIEEAKAKIETDVAALDERIQHINTLTNSLYRVDTQIRNLEGMVATNQKKAAALTRKLQDDGSSRVDLTEDVKELERQHQERESARATISQISEDLAYYSAIVDMLKDDGVKSVIVDKYLPIFNRLINEYLNRMGFFVQFTLDDTFNETILSRYRDKFSYASFSEGQKLRIDLAILMTWREIAKMKNSVNTNLLIMDEVFDSSLDQSGVDAFIDLLPEMENVNVFVVSHTPDKLFDKFRSQIEFKMEGNFSQMVKPQ